MPHASRSLIAVLVATVAFFALWLVALQPSSSNTPAKSGVGQLQSAINAARASAAAQNHAAAAGGNTVATTPAHTATTPAHTSAATAKPAATAPSHTAAATAKPKPNATPSAAPATAGQRLSVVDRALTDHRVLALLFYNPAGSDDQAVRHELTTIPTSHGRVVKLAVPLSELTNYPAITNQVQVESSPTLVIVDRSAQAFTLVGFADQFEIAHRVLDALSMS